MQLTNHNQKETWFNVQRYQRCERDGLLGFNQRDLSAPVMGYGHELTSETKQETSIGQTLVKNLYRILTTTSKCLSKCELESIKKINTRVWWLFYDLFHVFRFNKWSIQIIIVIIIFILLCYAIQIPFYLVYSR